ncbi:MAG: class I SAM-dependent methyltransferase, partial [Pseudomonadota bacterium]
MTDHTILKPTLRLPRSSRFRPGGRLETALILALGRRHTYGTLRVRLPGEREQVFRGHDEPEFDATMHIQDTRFVRRFLMRGAIGFAESYIDGDWDSPDLTGLLVLLDRNRKSWLESYHGNAFSRLGGRGLHWLRRNNRAGSRRNIKAHYDLGNAFYSAWLDPSLTYSSAYYGAGAKDLQTAQADKYRELCRRIDLQPGHRLLEIGCGWGSFSILAAREFGAQVTAITVSNAQHQLATQRVKDAGLDDKIEVRLQDYRDVSE